MLNQSDITLILKMHSEVSIYSPWSDKNLFKKIIDELSNTFLGLEIDKVVGIESRGFILGGAVAYKLDTGFVLIRKKDKMYVGGYSKDLVFSEECTDYSGEKKTLEIESGGKGIKPGDKVVIIDDWWGTGSQGKAAIHIIEKAGGKVVGVAVMLDEMTDVIKKDYESYNFHSLIQR